MSSRDQGYSLIFDSLTKDSHKMKVSNIFSKATKPVETIFHIESTKVEEISIYPNGPVWSPC